MTTTPNHASQNPVDEWLSRTFPLRHVLCAEIGTDLRGRTPIPVDVADKSFLGNLMELAIGLSVCDRPPYLHLLSLLGEDRAARLLRLAGYQTTGAPEPAGFNAWRHIGIAPEPARLFLTAYRLAQVIELLNPRWGGRVEPGAIAHILPRHPNALPRHAGETNFEWFAFADLWSSYRSGFHAALRSYGSATAQVALLGGLRQADLLVGTTVLEIKSGRLDHDAYCTQLIDQMITYALLAHYDGHPVTHVAVYAIRYQRLLRFRIEPLLDRLADGRLDRDAASADLADAVRASRYPYGHEPGSRRDSLEAGR